MGSDVPAAAVIDEAAATLRALDPDLILLQGVPDWRACTELAEALKPVDYNVLICSAFRGTSLTATGQTQVAILSKRKAYFTWSEVWQSQKQQPIAQGMAFAAVQAGPQRLGFFTALAGNRLAAEELPQKILKQIDLTGRWEVNQPQTFVMAASFAPDIRRVANALRKTVSAFERAGFVDATERIPQELKATVRPTPDRTKTVADCLFAGPMGFPLDTRITVSPFSDHYPVTCDIELDQEKVSTGLDIRAENRRARDAQARQVIRKTEYWAAGALVFGVVIVLGLRGEAKKRWASRGGLPVRIPTTSPPAQLRPIVFAQAEQKTRAPDPPVQPQTPRPVLRLQSSSGRVSHPTVEPPAPATPPSSAPVERQEQSPSEQVIERQEPPTPDAPRGLHTELRQGVIKELSSWLKHKLVRKLVTDRAEMMQAQQLATRMATTLDNRLARIEAQIQQQNQAYLCRIEELNRELAAAREENRELIRERIAQVKAEMEAARARALAEANLDNSSFRL
jgi:hypothetical protein